MKEIKININGQFTRELTEAFMNLKYGIFEDFYFSSQVGTSQSILYIKSNKMYEDLEVRSTLLEYMI